MRRSENIQIQRIRALGDVIPFRKSGESCATCRFFVPEDRYIPMMLDGPAYNYCVHPDRIGDRYLTDEIIPALNLHRRPDQWCRKYDGK